MLWEKRTQQKWLIEYPLDKGLYSGYTILLDESNFLDHKEKHPERYYYDDSMCHQFFDDLIPKAFENGKCYCQSKVRKQSMCLYVVYKQYSPTNKEFIKIVFEVKKKKIFIQTFYKVPSIAEQVCRQQMPN